MTNRGKTIGGQSISSSNSDSSASDALVEFIKIDERNASQATPSIPQQSNTNNKHEG